MLCRIALVKAAVILCSGILCRISPNLRLSFEKLDSLLVRQQCSLRNWNVSVMKYLVSCFHSFGPLIIAFVSGMTMARFVCQHIQKWIGMTSGGWPRAPYFKTIGFNRLQCLLE